MKSKLYIFFLLLLVSLFGKAQVVEVYDKNEGNAPVKDTTKVVVTPNLTNPLFEDYIETTIYLLPNDSLIRYALYRKNFTDQFLAEYETQRIYPASRIFGFSQDGKYYRSVKIDENNYVFAEKVNNGKMSFYYCRNLPHIYGDVEFSTSDPKNSGYRNTMITEDESRHRYRNDYHYFVTVVPDTSQLVHITNFQEFATKYLKDCPKAYDMAIKFKTNRYHKKIERIALPAIFVTAIAIIVANNFDKQIFLTVGGGTALVYGVYSFLTRHRKPDPTQVLYIVQAYNKCR